MDKDRALNLDELDKVVGGKKDDPESSTPWFKIPPENNETAINAWIERCIDELGFTRHAADAMLEQVMNSRRA